MSPNEKTGDVGTTPGSNWWVWRENLAHEAHHRGKDVDPPLRLSWERDLSRSGLSQAIFGKNAIYVYFKSYANQGADAGILHALSVDDGSTQWEFSPFPGRHTLSHIARMTCAASVANGKVYTGYMIFRNEAGAVYSEGSRGAVYALDESTGQVHWDKYLPETVWGAVTPVHGRLIVGYGSRIAALEQQSGEIVSQSDVGTFSCQVMEDQAPTVGMGSIVVAYRDGVKFFDLGSGAERGTGYRFPPGIVVSEEGPLPRHNYVDSAVILTEVAVGSPALILVGVCHAEDYPSSWNRSYSLTVYALHPPSGSLVWKKDLTPWMSSEEMLRQGMSHSVRLVAGEEQLFITSGRNVWALSSEAGSTQWHAELPRRCDGTPALSGQTLYLSILTQVVGLEIENGNAIWSVDLPQRDPPWDSENTAGVSGGISIDQGKLIVTTQTGLIFAFER